ncbi:hypothetical protein PF011_g11291 [Phytophthora fragariae]|uniref:Uncharacterized protein n=1 Tax=Phytophthora fragariae TaxID=53985 RepID=A0A6A3KI25_9STRA|nr:hypothetical protein PF011_g11291 [Phytophthora fragariae]
MPEPEVLVDITIGPYVASGMCASPPDSSDVEEDPGELFLDTSDSDVVPRADLSVVPTKLGTGSEVGTVDGSS